MCSPPSRNPSAAFTAFDRGKAFAAGSLDEVVASARRRLGREREAAILVFDDATGDVVDADLHGLGFSGARRLAAQATRPPDHAGPRGPGRPKLGVVAREVTLLPRHWEWLASQPGGASVALRRLVDDARKSRAGADRRRCAQEAAYRFMSAVAGDYPGYEEALRALFAGDRDRLTREIGAWPRDVRDYAARLAEGAMADEGRTA